MRIQLIATDMDGTFLDDHKIAPEANLRALEACAARGIQIVPATGRTVYAVPEEIRSLPGVRYGITTNGASVVDFQENRILHTCRMKAELAVMLMEMARDCGDDIMFDAYVDGIGYTTHTFYEKADYYTMTPELAYLVRKTRRPVDDNIAYIRTCGSDVEKVNMFFVDPDARTRMRERLSGVAGIVVTSAISNNLEINATGADKGSALAFLAGHLGIAIEETMAFGDGGNDLTMIRTAGIGVAMENGDEDVKAAADYVTVTNNEAGVAAAIRRFVFHEE